LGCNILYSYDKDLEHKLSRFQHMGGGGGNTKKVKKWNQKGYMNYILQSDNRSCAYEWSENWALNKSERRKTEIAEMCFLRHVSWYTLTDYVLSTAIQSTWQMHALGKRIQDYKNKWHNHILRMDSSRLTLKVQNYQPDGRMRR
jgi:hypothetical protein